MSWQDKELAALFENCYPNTLVGCFVEDFAMCCAQDTTIELFSFNGTVYDAFVITGDVREFRRVGCV